MPFRAALAAAAAAHDDEEGRARLSSWALRTAAAAATACGAC